MYKVYKTLPQAWKSILTAIYTKGENVPTEYGVIARSLYGVNAEIIEYDGSWHPQDKYCAIPGKPDVMSEKLKTYMQQFTYEYARSNHGFSYTYMERFVEPTDQIAIVRERLEKGAEFSRRLQLTTWRPEIDLFLSSCPCLQSIHIMPFENKTADVFITYRSWDAYGAMESNVIAIINMVQKYLFKPTGYKLNHVHLTGNNVHIYEHDLPAVENIVLN